MSRTDMLRVLVYSAVSSLTGLALLVFSLSVLRFGVNALPAKGTVLHIEEGRGADGGTTYRPVVSYVTRYGREATFTSGFDFSRKPTIGERVDVVYNPANPKQAQINSFTYQWLGPLLSLLLGLPLTALGIRIAVAVAKLQLRRMRRNRV